MLKEQDLRMRSECFLIFLIGFCVFVSGFEFDETEYHFNTSEVISLLEASKAVVDPNALIVGLTLIPGAAAKGAGIYICFDIQSLRIYISCFYVIIFNQDLYLQI